LINFANDVAKTYYRPNIFTADDEFPLLWDAAAGTWTFTQYGSDPNARIIDMNLAGRTLVDVVEIYLVSGDSSWYPYITKAANWFVSKQFANGTWDDGWNYVTKTWHTYVYAYNEADKGVTQYVGTQTTIAYALLKAYEVTGNETYRTMALKALNAVLTMKLRFDPTNGDLREIGPEHPNLVSIGNSLEAFYKAYKITGNSTYRHWARYYASLGLTTLWWWGEDNYRYGASVIISPVYQFIHCAIPWDEALYLRALNLLIANGDSTFNWLTVRGGAYVHMQRAQKADGIMYDSYDIPTAAYANTIGEGTALYLIVGLQYLGYSDPYAVSVTWTSSGLSGDASGTVLTVDSTAYAYSQLPKSFFWGPSIAHSVSATTPVSAGTGKRYVWVSWTNGNGLSGSSGTYTTPSSATTVTANYKTQWQISFTSSGIGGDTSGTVVTVNSNAKTQSQLPYTAWYDDAASISYTFEFRVNGTSKAYFWSSTSGLGQTLRSNMFTATESGTVSGSYQSTSPPANTCWAWTSGSTGGIVCVLDSYTFASAPENKTYGMTFDLRGQTLPSDQFKIQTWNTTSNAYAKVEVTIDGAAPSFVLNALNYSFASGTLTTFGQQANKTVTVDFNTINGLAAKIFGSTAVVTAAPSYDSGSTTLTIPTSGTSSSVTQTSGIGRAPYQVNLDGTPMGSSNWAYDSGSDVLTLTGTGTWDVILQSTVLGGGGDGTGGTGSIVVVPGTLPPTIQLALAPNQVFDVNEGQTLSTQIKLYMNSGNYPFILDSVTFSQPWVNVTDKLPAPYPIGTTQVTLHVTIKAPKLTTANIAQFLVQSSASWRINNQPLIGQGAFQVNVHPLTARPQSSFPWLQIALVAVVIVTVIYLITRLRR